MEKKMEIPRSLVGCIRPAPIRINDSNEHSRSGLCSTIFPEKEFACDSNSRQCYAGKPVSFGILVKIRMATCMALILFDCEFVKTNLFVCLACVNVLRITVGEIRFAMTNLFLIIFCDVQVHLSFPTDLLQDLG